MPESRIEPPFNSRRFPGEHWLWIAIAAPFVTLAIILVVWLVA